MSSAITSQAHQRDGSYNNFGRRVMLSCVPGLASRRYRVGGMDRDHGFGWRLSGCGTYRPATDRCVAMRNDARSEPGLVLRPLLYAPVRSAPSLVPSAPLQPTPGPSANDGRDHG